MRKTEPWPLDVEGGMWDATSGGRSTWDVRKWRQSVWTSESQARIGGYGLGDRLISSTPPSSSCSLSFFFFFFYYHGRSLDGIKH